MAATQGRARPRVLAEEIGAGELGNADRRANRDGWVGTGVRIGVDQSGDRHVGQGVVSGLLESGWRGPDQKYEEVVDERALGRRA